jgi:hypothetical protein
VAHNTPNIKIHPSLITYQHHSKFILLSRNLDWGIETLKQYCPSLVLNPLSFQCRPFFSFLRRSATLPFLQRSLLRLAMNPDLRFQQRFGTSLIHLETSFLRGVDGRRVFLRPIWI